MWQKWTLFDESTRCATLHVIHNITTLKEVIISSPCRVPLLISHPQSPFQGQRYSEPVELIDIFPSIVDMFPVKPTKKPCNKLHADLSKCLPLQGKSLAPVVLGTPVFDRAAPSFQYNEDIKALSLKGKNNKGHKKMKKSNKRVAIPSTIQSVSGEMPSLGKKLFALSQSWLCAFKKDLIDLRDVNDGKPGKVSRKFMSPFFDCNRDDSKYAEKRDEQISVMGYSFRTSSYRYSIWLHWDRVKNKPQLFVPPYAEELYDHQNETLYNFTHLELTNLIRWPAYRKVAKKMKGDALWFLKTRVNFRGPYVD